MIIYQLFLRPFSPDGTIKGIIGYLPRIAELGADVIYLTSCCKADGDSNQEYWSPRHMRSKIDNPKNPYRVMDYYKLDEEYGTIDDLRELVSIAHENSLRIIFDIVYLHCGPNAVFIGDHPDFVRRDGEGNIIYNAYRFPTLNFDSPELRRYLIDNMRFWIEKCGFDGFRCDVGDDIPLDFWREAVSELKADYPNLIMLNEGKKPEYIREVFDINYHAGWTGPLNEVLRGIKTADALVEIDRQTRSAYGDIKPVYLRGTENHDYANDYYDRRIDAVDSNAAELSYVLNFTLDGVPFIYNGNELADGNRHSIFGTRVLAKELGVDWSLADSEKARTRFEFLKSLTTFRKAYPALADCPVVWLESTAPKSLLAFKRELGESNIFVVANLSREEISAEIAFELKTHKTLFERGIEISCDGEKTQVRIAPRGFAVIKTEKAT